MYDIKSTPRFDKDVLRCSKKHWDTSILKDAIDAAFSSDEVSIPSKYKDHALDGELKGCRALHVPTAKNPPKDKWVLLYRIEGNTLYLLRTGTHDEVY
jgi:mRNA interferase YafQ